MAGGLVAGDEQEDELRAQLDIGEASPVHLGAEQSRDEVVLRLGASGGNERVDVGHELRVGAGDAFASLVAVLRGVGALHDLVGPCGPQPEVLGWRAQQVRDHVVRYRHHVLADEVDRPVFGQQRVEQFVAQRGTERLNSADAVRGDGGVDDSANLAVPGLGDLAD
ncbi:unannotated protein [freshwater metagenome]|uniref:Unannotated protein n=1 Tax=freshwater metagenome TaxID=449393 RepID=A0A6J7AW92_9ZZZZ